MSNTFFKALSRIFIIICILPIISYAEVKIVAIVGDEIITNHQLEEREKLMRVLMQKKPKDQLSASERNEITTSALRTLIDYNVAMAEFKNKGGSKIPEEAIDEQVKSIAEGNNMTLEQFAYMLRQGETSLEEFREFTKYQVVKSELPKFDFKELKVEEKEVTDKALNEKNYDGDIELEVYATNNTSTISRNAIERAWNNIKHPGNKPKKISRRVNHYVVNTKISKLDPQIKPIIKSLELNGKSNLINIDGGYKFYVLKNREIEEYNEDNKNELRNQIFYEKAGQAAEKLMIRLRKEAHIQLFGLPQAVTDELKN
jgi:peptidyl-prolyl cis-trans isomerase SurA